MSTCDILFIFGYLLICATAFFGHLFTLFVKIKNGDTWKETGMSCHEPKPYKFSFYENILSWGIVSLVPIINIFMIIYDVVYLADPFIKKLDEIVNNLFSAEGHD